MFVMTVGSGVFVIRVVVFVVFEPSSGVVSSFVFVSDERFSLLT